MNNTFLFPTLSALTGAALAVAMAATQPAQALNVNTAHRALARAVRATGIEVKINPQRCSDVESMGWYWASRKELVICQENATTTNVETAWTAEDLDTLRHEAHHLIQDCLDGRIDGKIKNVYRNPDALVQDVLTAPHIHRITAAYTGQGRASAVPTELEAFSVAALNDPGEQVRDIHRYCLGI